MTLAEGQQARALQHVLTLECINPMARDDAKNMVTKSSIPAGILCTGGLEVARGEAVLMQAGDQVEHKPVSKTGVPATDGPSDKALLDVIQNNIQRMPGNDNIQIIRKEPAKPGLLTTVLSGMAFAGVMVVGAIVMAVFKLVPTSEDSHY
ncbi:MAG: hypothetical protein KKH33_08115 [Alphaproteobacteria bacterium]|nr:hypothetical protein [Alphaproteobacteria bacterium]